MTAGIALVVLFYACAHVVSPTGGPRDEDPPEVVRSSPPNYSANFDDDQIRIFFNEFVALHNIRQQLLVSPPMETMPEVRIRGRSIVMDIEEDMRPNTTYNFFFGDAIRDITEGNAIPNFQFVVSTGDHVDSLALGGQVKNAFNLAPEEGVYVMIYDNIYDSVPYLERPVYLAKTDKNGKFTISNMAEGSYKMFALDDRNYNFKYDLPEEWIGFLDSLVSPRYFEAVHDTLEDGTLNPLPDIGHSYTLYLFQEEDTVQRITSSRLVREGLIEMVFRVPFDSAHVREIKEPFDQQWHVPEFGIYHDTLRIWFAETGRDTLHLEVLDGDQVLDTIVRSTRPRRPARQPDEEEEPVLNISPEFRRRGAVPFFRPLTLRSDHPLAEIDTGRIQLYIHDSIPHLSHFYVTDQALRTAEMYPPLEEETSYRLDILPGAFTDIYGLTNDTLGISFTTNSRENYGNLILDVEVPETGHQNILQLLNTDQDVLQEKIISEGGRYVFRHLTASRYLVRLIEDLDGSGSWTTGHYLRQRQPEPVHMLSDTIQIRENWDVEMPWTITPFNSITP